MSKNDKYTKDVAFIEKIDTIASKKVQFMAYFIGLASCLAVHILYLVMFAGNGIKEMAVFNIFSVLFYILMILLVIKVKEKLTLVYCSLAEIIIHASVSTIFTGWTPDFGMFLLMVIPLTFLMPNKKKNIPFIVMFVTLILYGSLRLFYQDSQYAKYNLEHTRTGTVFYIINIIIGTFVLIYVSSIYTVINQYTECKIRVQNEQLRIMASVDPLTKLINRRAMGDELKKVSATGRSYVIGLGDIDNFKNINDSYGHDSGDNVLTEVAAMITGNIPESGFAARWGGEEFLFVLPESDLNDGYECAERIIKAISCHKFTNGSTDFFVTMTFGVCDGLPGDDTEKVINHADKRLYKGKRNGKNHTEYTD